MQPLPFLELPTCLPGLQDGGSVDNEDKIVTGKYMPITIVAYHPSYHGRTMIYLQNGQPFLIELPVEKYEEQIKGYYKIINTPSKIKTLN